MEQPAVPVAIKPAVTHIALELFEPQYSDGAQLLLSNGIKISSYHETDVGHIFMTSKNGSRCFPIELHRRKLRQGVNPTELRLTWEMKAGVIHLRSKNPAAAEELLQFVGYDGGLHRRVKFVMNEAARSFWHLGIDFANKAAFLKFLEGCTTGTPVAQEFAKAYSEQSKIQLPQGKLQESAEFRIEVREITLEITVGRALAENHLPIAPKERVNHVDPPRNRRARSTPGVPGTRAQDEPRVMVGRREH